MQLCEVTQKELRDNVRRATWFREWLKEKKNATM